MRNRRNRKRIRRRGRLYLRRITVVAVTAVVLFLMWWGGAYVNEFFNSKAPKEIQAANSDINQGKQEKKESDNSKSRWQEADFSGACVVLDAGHGGTDGGTVGGDIVEKDINLAVTLKTKAILEQHNIEVVLTRDSDENVSLSHRVTLENNYAADLFVSFHCNYYEDDFSVAGMECYHRPDSKEGKGYAESIIKAAESSGNIGVRAARADNYYVLDHTTMPAVLIEMGFLSNAGERERLSDKDYQEMLARQIAEGIMSELK